MCGCVHMCLSACAHVCAGTCRGQKRASDILELQAVKGYLMWVLESERFTFDPNAYPDMFITSSCVNNKHS